MAISWQDVEDIVSMSPRQFVASRNSEQPKTTKAQFIYLIHAPRASLVKIGITTDLESRFAALRTSSPVPLYLVKSFEGDKALEKELHDRFSGLRSHASARV